MTESPLFNVKSDVTWNALYPLARAVSIIADTVERVVDQINLGNGTARISDVMRDVPQTEIFLDVLMRNLAPLTLDVVDMLTIKAPVHYISLIKEYMTKEVHWPCVFNESLGVTLELRNGSREIVREIERLACNPGLFVKEWKEHAVFSAVRKLFANDSKNELTLNTAFNWTGGYGRFRALVNKIETLVNKADDVVLADDRGVVLYSKVFIPDIKKMIEDSLPKVETESKTIFDYVDMEIDKNIDVLRSNKTAAEVWLSLGKNRNFDDMLVIAKFSTRVVHEFTKLFISVLSQSSKNVSLLKLLGFTNRSSVSVIYERLPHIAATIINGMSDPTLDDRAYESLQGEKIVTCADVFSWFSDYRIGLTAEEYSILKISTCDADPENFNAFTDIYLNLMTVWRQPVSRYRSHVFSLARELYELGDLATDFVADRVIVALPFTESYFQNFLTTLKEDLATSKAIDIPKLSKDSTWWTYRMTIEGLSRVLDHAVTALSDPKLKDNRFLHTWDFVESGDVRQLIKILESHPTEAIALAATLTTLNSTTHKSVPFDEFRHEMCNSHFHSEYWSTENRKHFLNQVCVFDPHQLLRSATGDDFYDAIVKGLPTLQHAQPLSRSVTRFIGIMMNLRGSPGESRTFESNLFNATAWAYLPDDTRELVRKAQRSWAKQMAVPSVPASRNLLRFMQWTEIAGFLMELSEGGDVWTKWKTRYESPKSKAMIALLEDSPNIAVTIIDTFVGSERLTDFVARFMTGSVNGCDIEKYLIPPAYIRRKGFLSSIGNFCRKVLYDNATTTYTDLIPMEHTLRSVLRSWKKYSDGVISVFHEDESFLVQENYVVQEIEKLETSLTRLSMQGPKPAKTPSWWTSFVAGAYIDFSKQYKVDDLKPLTYSIVDKSMTVLNDILSPSFASNCSWCNSFIVQIVNSQLSHHRVYSKLLCDINRTKYSTVKEIFERDLYWNKTISMIQDYEHLSKRRDLAMFIMTARDALRYVSDIIIDYAKPVDGRNLTDCFLRAVGGSKSSGIGLYVKLLIGMLDSFQNNIHILDTSSNHANIMNLTKMSETFVPIWKPLREVVKSSDIKLADELLPNASIDVNLLVSQRHDSPCPKPEDCSSPDALQNYLGTKSSSKLLRYDPKASNYPSTIDIAKLLTGSLDFDDIRSHVSSWRRAAAWNLEWLKKLMRNLNSVLEEGGSLLNVASRIDFSDASSALGVPDVADGVISLVKDKTIDKLFAGLKEIVDDVEPFLADDSVRRDLRTIVETFESMEIFKNLGLLDIKYVVSEMFQDWNTLRRFIVEEIKIPNEVAEILSHGKIDMLSVFMKERKSISLKDTVCSPVKLRDMLSFDATETNVEEVSTALCRLDDAATQNVTVSLIQNLNFDYIFSTLMSANVKNILKNANLTDVEGQAIFDNLGVAAELVPVFKDKLSAGFSTDDTSQDTQPTEKMSHGKFLQDTSKMMCGKALVTENGDFYRVISSIKDKKKAFDQKELDSLPTEFCKDTYKNVLEMTAGKIVWSYVKPLLRGQILYAPNTTAIRRVMGLANETFSQMGSFGQLMDAFERTLRSLADLSEMGQSLKDLKDVMSSNVMKIAVKSMSNGRLEADFSEFDLGDVAWRIKRSGKLIDMVGMLNDFMECVLVERIRGFATEEEMESEARRLTDVNEFLAGVVFLDPPERSRRSIDDEQLPQDVVYKIRMDVDYVPSTKRMKTQFWIPGPEADFLENLRYLRGFVQLQDSIDRAIVRDKSGITQNWKTVTQQMPYPCWKNTK